MIRSRHQLDQREAAFVPHLPTIGAPGDRPEPRVSYGAIASDAARVSEPVDEGALKALAPEGACGFESHPGHGTAVPRPAEGLVAV